MTVEEAERLGRLNTVLLVTAKLLPHLSQMVVVRDANSFAQLALTWMQAVQQHYPGPTGGAVLESETIANSTMMGVGVRVVIAGEEGHA